MEGASHTLDLPAEAVGYKLNAGQDRLFNRVDYADDNLDALGLRIQDKTLDHMDRWGVQNDLYALVRFRPGDPLVAYLDFPGPFLPMKTQYLPLVSIAGHLGHAHLVAGEKRARRRFDCRSPDGRAGP